jgi:RNA polymerase sigma-70 factor (ECF subfamily)
MSRGHVPARPPLRTNRPATFRSRTEQRASAVAVSPEIAQPASGPEPASAPSAPLDFDRLYVEHFHHVLRWVRALGGRPADLDDLTQDVFVVVRRKLSTFTGPSLPAWLYGITRKTVSDYRRRAWIRRLLAGRQRSLDALPVSAQVSGVEAVERREARRILQRVLDQMSTVRRSAFVLFEIEGYSGDEIAELEQVPLATVYTRLHHARKDFLRLTAALTGDVAEEPPS